jgi:hypothetical protein
MWQLSTWQAVYFTIAQDGDAATGKKALAGFSGIALGDAASVHKAMARAGDFRMAFCWSHARRGFIKAEVSEPIRSRQFIDMVAELYAIEAQAPPGPLGDDIRRKLRHEKSRPIVARIKEWLLEQRFLPGSDFGKAVKYVVGNWNGLVVFLDEPAVPIDNNRTERGFRGPALGRNNFYGSKSKRGTEVAAILYSLVETAKLVGIDPKQYLKVAPRGGAQRRARPAALRTSDRTLTRYLAKTNDSSRSGARRGFTVKVCAPATHNNLATDAFGVRRDQRGCPAGYPPVPVRPRVSAAGADFCTTDVDCNQGTDAGRCAPDMSLMQPDGGHPKACLCTAGTAAPQCPNNGADVTSECKAGVRGQTVPCVQSIVCLPSSQILFADAGAPSFGCGL